MTKLANPPPADPLWYKDALIYELHIRAFKDANGDGIGDIEGMIDKLDYLVDLGVTAIWLLPFYPSPLRDGGYDIADYTGVHENYGTRRDFGRFLRAAHRRGLRVITELVLNHTSADHPWFQRARKAPAGSNHRDFYVWSDTPARYDQTRIIFRDFETSNWSWDPVANAYYWHRFYAHQPDLNFDNPEVHEALFEVMDFWMEMGVDGMRLDAVPYLFERDNTTCENLPETHAFLRKLRKHIDGKFANRMLLAEANQWPTDAAAYFGDGDECHMNFHFPLMPRMFMAIELEDSFPIINILRRTPKIPDSCQWATFLRNHDELTLEMVTDEDRDTLYRAYATERHARLNLGIRRRLSPLLMVRRKVELMNALLLSLPGTPVIYYGDEIGMGDNIYLGDRDGVRTPMQWSGDRNGGFSRANPQKLYLPTIIDPEFHYEAVNVEAQQSNPSSLLWWMKRLIAKRKEHRVFGRGTIEFPTSDNPRVLGFVREYQGERVLVLANLSRFVQCARFHLRELSGFTPVEMFGRMRFPEITDAPYFVSLGPHGFYWLSLEGDESHVHAPGQVPALTCRGNWTAVVSAGRGELARVLTAYARERRWFRGKSRALKDARVADVIRTGEDHVIVLLHLEYQHGAAETYAMPLAFVSEERGEHHVPPQGVVATLTVTDVPGHGEHPRVGILVDAVYTERFGTALLAAIRSRKASASGDAGQLAGVALRSLKELPADTNLAHHVPTTEQSNSSIVYGDRFMLKLFRVVAEGPSTEYEIGRALTGRNGGFRGVARLAGALEYKAGGREASTLATLFDYVPNSVDAWRLALDSIGRYFTRLLSDENRPEAPPSSGQPLLVRVAEGPEGRVIDWMGPFLDRIRLLGVRTAELHRVLGAETDDALFAPTPFDMMHQQSLYQSAGGMMSRVFDVVRGKLPALPDAVRPLAERALAAESAVDQALARIAYHKLDAVRIRIHGDYHLGQVLWTGDDFVIIDFEGEPARPLSVRRFKRNVLRDVAGMLRSLSYAGEAALRDGRIRAEDVAVVAPWARAWSQWASTAFVAGYLEILLGNRLLPADPTQTATLLDHYLLEKCIYEIGYELDNRPDWVEIPLRGLLELVGAEP